MNRLQSILLSLSGRSASSDTDRRSAYGELLSDYYRTIGVQVNDPAARQVADTLVARLPKLTWEEIYSLELAIVKLEPPDALMRRAWALRGEYKEIAPAAAYERYLASKPPEPTSANVDALRADLVSLQSELHWRYLVMQSFETYRDVLVSGACWSGLIAMALLAFGWWFFEDFVCTHLHLALPVIICVLAAGIMGGFTSTLRRVAQDSTSGSADVDLAKAQQGLLGLLVSPLLGGIFAAVLALIFLGKFIDSTLFPALSNGSFLCGTDSALDAANFGKLMVWSFIAGFAEQFVPDNLSRLVDKAKAAPLANPNPRSNPNANAG